MNPTRDNRWYNRNNFSTNEEYTIKVLNKFNITKYNFVYDEYGELCLVIEKNLKKYKIIINPNENKMLIYRCMVNNMFAKNTKENMVLKKYFNDDCIWDSIKWVSNDSKI